MAADALDQETCAASEPSPVNNKIDPPITYSACATCPVATITDSNQRITSIGDARDNGTHTYVPYYFAGFHEWVFAYTKTVTLYMSLSAVNGQQPAATDTEVRTTYTYSLSITSSVISVSRSSSVYESTSRISRTGPVVINSGSSDESTINISTAPTVLIFTKTDYYDSTAFAPHTLTLPATAASTASFSNFHSSASNLKEKTTNFIFPPTVFPWFFPTTSAPTPTRGSSKSQKTKGAQTTKAAQGAKGTKGTQRTSGTQGTSGIQGTSRAQGVDGSQTSPGSSGTTTASSPAETLPQTYFDLYANTNDADGTQNSYPIAKANDTNDLQMYQSPSQYIKALSVYVNENGELIEKNTGGIVYLAPSTDFSESTSSRRRRKKRDDSQAWSMQFSKNPPSGAIKNGFNIGSSGSLNFDSKSVSLQFAYCTSQAGQSVKDDVVYGLASIANHANCVAISLLAVDSKKLTSSQAARSSTASAASSSNAAEESSTAARQQTQGEADSATTTTSERVASSTVIPFPGSTTVSSEDSSRAITLGSSGSIQTVVVTMDDSEFSSAYTASDTGTQQSAGSSRLDFQSPSSSLAESASDPQATQPSSTEQNTTGIGATESLGQNTPTTTQSAEQTSEISQVLQQSDADTASSFSTPNDQNVGIPAATSAESSGVLPSSSNIGQESSQSDSQDDNAQSPTLSSDSGVGTVSLQPAPSSQDGLDAGSGQETAPLPPILGDESSAADPSLSTHIDEASPPLTLEPQTTFTTGADGQETTIVFTPSLTEESVASTITTTGSNGVEGTTLVTLLPSGTDEQSNLQTFTSTIQTEDGEGSTGSSTLTFVSTIDPVAGFPETSLTQDPSDIITSTIATTDEDGNESTTVVTFATSPSQEPTERAPKSFTEGPTGSSTEEPTEGPTEESTAGPTQESTEPDLILTTEFTTNGDGDQETEVLTSTAPQTGEQTAPGASLTTEITSTDGYGNEYTSTYTYESTAAPIIGIPDSQTTQEPVTSTILTTGEDEDQSFTVITLQPSATLSEGLVEPSSSTLSPTETTFTTDFDDGNGETVITETLTATSDPSLTTEESIDGTFTSSNEDTGLTSVAPFSSSEEETPGTPIIGVPSTQLASEDIATSARTGYSEESTLWETTQDLQSQTGEIYTSISTQEDGQTTAVEITESPQPPIESFTTSDDVYESTSAGEDDQTQDSATQTPGSPVIGLPSETDASSEGAVFTTVTTDEAESSSLLQQSQDQSSSEPTSEIIYTSISTGNDGQSIPIEITGTPSDSSTSEEILTTFTTGEDGQTSYFEVTQPSDTPIVGLPDATTSSQDSILTTYTSLEDTSEAYSGSESYATGISYQSGSLSSGSLTQIQESSSQQAIYSSTGFETGEDGQTTPTDVAISQSSEGSQDSEDISPSTSGFETGDPNAGFPDLSTSEPIYTSYSTGYDGSETPNEASSTSTPSLASSQTEGESFTSISSWDPAIGLPETTSQDPSASSISTNAVSSESLWPPTSGYTFETSQTGTEGGMTSEQILSSDSATSTGLTSEDTGTFMGESTQAPSLDFGSSAAGSDTTEVGYTSEASLRWSFTSTISAEESSIAHSLPETNANLNDQESSTQASDGAQSLTDVGRGDLSTESQSSTQTTGGVTEIPQLTESTPFSVPQTLRDSPGTYTDENSSHSTGTAASYGSSDVLQVSTGLSSEEGSSPPESPSLTIPHESQSDSEEATYTASSLSGSESVEITQATELLSQTTDLGRSDEISSGEMTTSDQNEGIDSGTLASQRSSLEASTYGYPTNTLADLDTTSSSEENETETLSESPHTWTTSTENLSPPVSSTQGPSEGSRVSTTSSPTAVEVPESDLSGSQSTGEPSSYNEYSTASTLYDRTDTSSLATGSQYSEGELSSTLSYSSTYFVPTDNQGNIVSTQPTSSIGDSSEGTASTSSYLSATGSLTGSASEDSHQTSSQSESVPELTSTPSTEQETSSTLLWESLSTTGDLQEDLPTTQSPTGTSETSYEPSLSFSSPSSVGETQFETTDGSVSIYSTSSSQVELSDGTTSDGVSETQGTSFGTGSPVVNLPDYTSMSLYLTSSSIYSSEAPVSLSRTDESSDGSGSTGSFSLTLAETTEEQTDSATTSQAIFSSDQNTGYSQTSSGISSEETSRTEILGSAFESSFSVTETTNSLDNNQDLVSTTAGSLNPTSLTAESSDSSYQTPSTASTSWSVDGTSDGISSLTSEAPSEATPTESDSGLSTQDTTSLPSGDGDILSTEASQSSTTASSIPPTGLDQDTTSQTSQSSAAWEPSGDTSTQIREYSDISSTSTGFISESSGTTGSMDENRDLPSITSLSEASALTETSISESGLTTSTPLAEQSQTTSGSGASSGLDQSSTSFSSTSLSDASFFSSVNGQTNFLSSATEADMSQSSTLTSSNFLDLSSGFSSLAESASTAPENSFSVSTSSFWSESSLEISMSESSYSDSESSGSSLIPTGYENFPSVTGSSASEETQPSSDISASSTLGLSQSNIASPTSTYEQSDIPESTSSDRLTLASESYTLTMSRTDTDIAATQTESTGSSSLEETGTNYSISGDVNLVSSTSTGIGASPGTQIGSGVENSQISSSSYLETSSFTSEWSSGVSSSLASFSSQTEYTSTGGNATSSIGDNLGLVSTPTLSEQSTSRAISSGTAQYSYNSSSSFEQLSEGSNLSIEGTSTGWETTNPNTSLDPNQGIVSTTSTSSRYGASVTSSGFTSETSSALSNSTNSSEGNSSELIASVTQSRGTSGTSIDNNVGLVSTTLSQSESSTYASGFSSTSSLPGAENGTSSGQPVQSSESGSSSSTTELMSATAQSPGEHMVSTDSNSGQTSSTQVQTSAFSSQFSSNATLGSSSFPTNTTTAGPNENIISTANGTLQSSSTAQQSLSSIAPSSSATLSSALSTFFNSSSAALSSSGSSANSLNATITSSPTLSSSSGQPTSSSSNSTSSEEGSGSASFRVIYFASSSSAGGNAKLKIRDEMPTPYFSGNGGSSASIISPAEATGIPSFGGNIGLEIPSDSAPISGEKDAVLAARAQIEGYGMEISFCMPYLNLIKKAATETITSAMATEMIGPYQTFTAGDFTINKIITNREVQTQSSISTIYSGVLIVQMASTKTQTIFSTITATQTVPEGQSTTNTFLTQNILLSYTSTSTILSGIISITTTIPQTLTLYSTAPFTTSSKLDTPTKIPANVLPRSYYQISYPIVWTGDLFGNPGILNNYYFNSVPNFPSDVHNNPGNRG
ncbi:hypothetical protein ABW19_dt0210140 [Dactylella cylindrospora]|nr:hypothetical protein ABW19_dt0210140 [Dactylella cylindrospora]